MTYVCTFSRAYYFIQCALLVLCKISPTQTPPDKEMVFPPMKCWTGLGPNTFRFSPTFPTETLTLATTRELAVEENMA